MMPIDCDRYLFSTGTHYISNSGHDENGKYHGGAAGDQSTGEWSLRGWYNRPWTAVLRYPDRDVALTIARLAVAAALNDRIGYDQHQRLSYWKQLSAAGFDPSAIAVACEADCTAGVTANVKAAGYLRNVPALKALDEDTYSANMKRRFVKAGFQALADEKYLKGYDWLLPGDILLYESHHAATNVTQGRFAAFPGGGDSAADASRGPCERILRFGCKGDDVRLAQRMLEKLGYDLGYRGADGEFGSRTDAAVRAYQRDVGLDADGEIGPMTLAALKKDAGGPDAAPMSVCITGGSCWVRSAPNTSGEKLGAAKEGGVYPYAGQTSENGWLRIVYGDRSGWVSGKYGRLSAETDGR